MIPYVKSIDNRKNISTDLLKLIGDFYSWTNISFYCPVLSGHRTSLELWSCISKASLAFMTRTWNNVNAVKLIAPSIIIRLIYPALGVLWGRISFLRIRRKYWAWNQPRLKTDMDCMWERNNAYIFKSNRYLLRARTIPSTFPSWFIRDVQSVLQCFISCKRHYSAKNCKKERKKIWKY